MASSVYCYLTNSSTVSFFFVHYRAFPVPSMKEVQTFPQQCVPSLTYPPISIFCNILVTHLCLKYCNPSASTSQVQQCDHS